MSNVTVCGGGVWGGGGMQETNAGRCPISIYVSDCVYVCVMYKGISEGRVRDSTVSMLDPHVHTAVCSDVIPR